MMRRWFHFIFLPILFFGLFPPLSHAAQLIGNETITITSSSASLEDLYLFGEKISVNAPVENDIVTAGGNIDLQGSTTGSVLAAGKNLTISTAIGNTLRAAGGDIIINSTVARDAVIAGGQIRLSEKARINRDLLIAGGQVVIHAPVRGKLLVNAGEVIINSTIGGNVGGNIGKLKLGDQAVINGDLKYRSAERATVAQGATVRGEHLFTQTETPEQAKKGIQALFTTGTLYKLIVDILVSLLLVYFFRHLLETVFHHATTSPVKRVSIGFTVLFLMPLVSLLLLVLFLLGIVSFVFYLFILLASIIIGKVYLGWIIMQFWEKRHAKKYVLDYKAAVIGPLIMYLLFLIPFIGWLAACVIYLFTIGTISLGVYEFVKQQQLPPKTSLRKIN